MFKPALMSFALSLALPGVPAFAAPASAGPAATACSLAQAPAADFIVRVPFDVVDGRIYVTTRVNDRGPFRFAVDTGASGIGRADATLVASLGLKAHGKDRSDDGVQSAAVDTVRLDSLALGGLARQSVEVIARDYSSRLTPEATLHGILARDFFADGLLILDYPARTLSFSRTLSLPAGGEALLAYERAFRVPVRIGAAALEANLDTGANVGLVMPLALYEQVSGAALQDAGKAGLANTRIATWRGTLAAPLAIGPARIAGMEVRVAERYPEVLVGAHVLQKFTMMIDQRSRRIVLCD